MLRCWLRINLSFQGHFYVDFDSGPSWIVKVKSLQEKSRRGNDCLYEVCHVVMYFIGLVNLVIIYFLSTGQ